MDRTLTLAYCETSDYPPQPYQSCIWADDVNWSLYCYASKWYVCYGTISWWCVFGGVDNTDNCPPEGVYPFLAKGGQGGGPAWCNDTVTFIFVGNGRN